MLVVDGRRPGYSAGMTNFELAQTMARLGVVTASALDAGGSSTMAFDGKLLSRPSDRGGERLVSEALLVMYYGVHAPET
jgi:exopolysaccharide biosynthesis protein